MDSPTIERSAERGGLAAMATDAELTVLLAIGLALLAAVLFSSRALSSRR
jgi:hypothetical protein